MATSDGPKLIRDHKMSELRIVSGGGGVERHLAVHCDARDASVDIATCGQCERCLGVRMPYGREPGVVRCVSLAHDRKPSQRGRSLRTPVTEVMSRDVVCVTEDASIDAVSALLLDRGWNATAVVDARGALVGMISKTDLLRAANDAAGTVELSRSHRNTDTDPSLNAVREGERTVGDVMMPVVFAVPGHVELSRAAALMAMENLHQLPVVSEGGLVLGILTSLDALAWVAELDGFVVHTDPEPP